MDEGAEFLFNHDDESVLDLALIKRQRDVALAIVRHDR
jgi:hypothetical protein